MLSIRTWTALAATGVALAASGSATAKPGLAHPATRHSHTAHKVSVGTQDEGQVYTGNAAASVQAAKNLGATRWREIVDWRRVETAPGQYDWHLFDAAVDAANANHMKVQIVLGGVATQPPPFYGANDQQAYLNFVKAAAEHWGDKVALWSFLNEVDATGIAPCEYRDVFRKAEAIIKSTTHGKTLLGEFSPMGLGFFKKVMRCGPITTDGVAVHPYQWDKAPLKLSHGRQRLNLGNLPHIKQLLDTRWKNAVHTRKGTPAKIYISEVGYLTRGPKAVPERTAGRWWKQLFKVAESIRTPEVIAYHLSEAGTDEAWDSSLVRSDGSTRPAYRVIYNYTHEQH